MSDFFISPLDFSRLKVFPLAARKSLTRCEDILLQPDSSPPPLGAPMAKSVREAATAIRRAREAGAGVHLLYGAHLLRNGAALILDRLLEAGWLTHLAPNGAGSIHDWEYAWVGASTESVEANVASGTFGCWEETGTYLHLALMAGALDGLGYGRALGRFIHEDGVLLPAPELLERLVREEPAHPDSAARVELLRFLQKLGLPAGRLSVPHRWKHASIFESAWRHKVPLTVHPGIGYDIVSNHPHFNGAVLGRAAELDFRLFSASVDTLDGGVVLSIGSAIMGPQVFEKSLSCVNNLRLQDGRFIVSGHTIFVVDLQDGGSWDWTAGEPPKSHPAYYLRFCKSFSRMGAPMHYLQCDNATFLHHLLHALHAPASQP